jgi:hypothetical protein
MALVPTTSYDPTSPAGNQAISLGDDAIRLLKVQIQEVINVDHDFPASGQASDVGQHKQVTLQEQADLGTGAAGATILGSQTVSSKGELVYTDEDDNDVQITSGGKLRAESLGGVYPAANLAAMATLLDKIYPIGFVVTLGVSTNPNTLFGIGTWTAIAGKVIVGLDSGQTEFDTLNETGGAKTHTLSTSEIPSHAHKYYHATGGSGGASSPGGAGSGNIWEDTDTTGGGGAHNNLQPYIVKYVWERTA